MINKKIFFISSFNPQISNTNGVAKKLLLEIETFKRFGYQVDYTEISYEGVFLNSEGESSFIAPWKGNYHRTFTNFYKKLSQLSLDYDIVYFRYEHISLQMLSFFRSFKKGGNKLIIGELPTYMKKPYGGLSISSKIIFYLKRLMSVYLPKKIDYLVTFSEHQRLFRINTINIENFIDLDLLQPRKLKVSCKDECHLLVLAQLTPAHGVDLVIEGLKNYYQKENSVKCYLHIVGEGDILQSLKSLTINSGLEDVVIFHNSLGGEKLSNIFDICDIGIGALAIFRKGSYKLSELKIREYTARCLPFVYNAYEPQIENTFFCKKLVSEDKPVDIQCVIDFYKNFDYNEEKIKNMRLFAEENFSADVQLGLVNDRINQYFNK